METEKNFAGSELSLAVAERALEVVPSMPMTGWLDLPVAERSAELKQIKELAARIRQSSEVLVCVGIGGSYLGHKALIEALVPQAAQGGATSTRHTAYLSHDTAYLASDVMSATQGVEVLFAGNSLDALALDDLLARLGERDFAVNVISKSGTTTEVLIAWRILRQKLQERYGQDWAQRVYVTTDAQTGQLHAEAEARGFAQLVLPGDVGGRYSVLSSVGLLPLAAAGVDIDMLLAGARAEYHAIFGRSDPQTPSVSFTDPQGYVSTGRAAVLNYAYVRQQLYRTGVDTEVLASFHPRLAGLAAWWQQLFGESEGKNDQGIFPAVATYSTDLHSLGQFMQQGRRNLLETIVRFERMPGQEHTVPADLGQTTPAAATGSSDWLAGKSLKEINRAAETATITAHQAGHLAVAQITLPDFSAASLGALIYYFEVACAVSALLAGVNPFDQPGVEAYKQEMFRLLGRDGQQEAQ